MSSTKLQLINAILERNPSASAEWLARFETAALERYFDHLQQAAEPRGGQSYWRRDAETPAAVTRRPAA